MIRLVRPRSWRRNQARRVSCERPSFSHSRWSTPWGCGARCSSCNAWVTGPFCIPPSVAAGLTARSIEEKAPVIAAAVRRKAWSICRMDGPEELSASLAQSGSGLRLSGSIPSPPTWENGLWSGIGPASRPPPDRRIPEASWAVLISFRAAAARSRSRRTESSGRASSPSSLPPLMSGASAPVEEPWGVLPVRLPPIRRGNETALYTKIRGREGGAPSASAVRPSGTWDPQDPRLQPAWSSASPGRALLPNSRSWLPSSLFKFLHVKGDVYAPSAQLEAGRPHTGQRSSAPRLLHSGQKRSSSSSRSSRVWTRHQR